MKTIRKREHRTRIQVFRCKNLKKWQCSQEQKKKQNKTVQQMYRKYLENKSLTVRMYYLYAHLKCVQFSFYFLFIFNLKNVTSHSIVVSFFRLNYITRLICEVQCAPNALRVRLVRFFCCKCVFLIKHNIFYGFESVWIDILLKIDYYNVKYNCCLIKMRYILFWLSFM